MIDNLRSYLASWVRKLQATPDHILNVCEIEIKKDLFTSKELLNFYDPTGGTKTTSNGLGREMSRAGFRQVCGGTPIKLSNGSQGRYFAVKNSEKWLEETTSKKAVKHIEKVK